MAAYVTVGNEEYRNSLAWIELVHRILRFFAERCRTTENKKADVAEHPKVFNHVGLLANEPPARASCPSSSHPTKSSRRFYGDQRGRQGGSTRVDAKGMP